MSANTSIQWTDRSWNPIRGCSVISPGCVNCYAMKQAHRFSGDGKAYAGLTKLTKAGPQWTGKIATIEYALLEPLSWKKPSRVFVNSMADLFHEDVPFAFVDKVFAVMAMAPRHTFQVLTKRADRMRAYMMGEGIIGEISGRSWRIREAGHAMKVKIGADVNFALPIRNVWLGVSVENQKYADERIPLLLQTPAAVRFISAEPLLGPVNFRPFFYSFDVKSPGQCAACGNGHGFTRCPNYGGVAKTYQRHACGPTVCGQFVKPTGVGIDLVIFGGESGPEARLNDVSWTRQGVQQCREAGVSPFVKQIGARPCVGDDAGAGPAWDFFKGKRRRYWWMDDDTTTPMVVYKIHDKKGGDMSEWPADLRVREFPVVSA